MQSANIVKEISQQLAINGVAFNGKKSVLLDVSTQEETGNLLTK